MYHGTGSTGGKSLWTAELMRSLRSLRRVLIANRGEIALRIARAAHELQFDAVTLATPADEKALHAVAGSDVISVPSYTDTAAVVAAAVRSGCDLLHPGYGFLSESAALAIECERAGIAFCGPTPSALETLGDKVAARQLAASVGVPVPPGRLCSMHAGRRRRAEGVAAGS